MLADIRIEFKDVICGSLGFGVWRRGRSCAIALVWLEFAHIVVTVENLAGSMGGKTETERGFWKLFCYLSAIDLVTWGYGCPKKGLIGRALSTSSKMFPRLEYCNINRRGHLDSGSILCLLKRLDLKPLKSF